MRKLSLLRVSVQQQQHNSSVERKARTARAEEFAEEFTYKCPQ